MKDLDKNTVDYSLYLCTDRELMSTKTVEECVELAIRGGVTVVQLREKHCSSKEFLETALSVKKITDCYQVPLIINDRADIAMAADASGVHLGQKDLPVGAVRKMLGPDKLIGVSAATLSEAEKARDEGADYLGIGAMFATGTKLNTRPVSKETLSEIRKKVDIPIVVIGGIQESNVSCFEGIGIDGIAVISAIVSKPDVEEAAKKLHLLFQGLS